MPILPPPSKIYFNIVPDAGLEYIESQRLWRHSCEQIKVRAEAFEKAYQQAPFQFEFEKKNVFTQKVDLPAERNLLSLLLSSIQTKAALPNPKSENLSATEVYYISLTSEGLNPGVYHLRKERGAVEKLPASISAQYEPNRILPEFNQQFSRHHVAGIVLLTSVLDRLRLKYGHAYLRIGLIEAGKIAEKLEIAATSINHYLKHFNFVDELESRRLLGIDGTSETVVHSAIILNRAGQNL